MGTRGIFATEGHFFMDIGFMGDKIIITMIIGILGFIRGWMVQWLIRYGERSFQRAGSNIFSEYE